MVCVGNDLRMGNTGRVATLRQGVAAIVGAAALLCAPTTSSADELMVAALSPAEIRRDTAQAQPIDLAAMTVEAPPGSDIVEIGYKIHLGGFHLAQVNVRTVMHEDEYVSVSKVETKGLVDVFASADIQLISTGEVIEGRVAPRTYNSDQIEKNKRQLVGLLFGQEGPLEIDANPPYDLERFPVSEDLKRRTVDPLSAALFVTLGSTASRSEPCGEIVPIFDGKRRYNLNLTYIETEEINLGRDGGYNGEALHCRLEYERVAGFKPPKPGKRKTQVPPIDIWLAPFNDGKLMIPVRMQADSDFGGAVVRATNLTVKTQPAQL